MDKFSITQHGTQLDKSLYYINVKDKIFASKSCDLVLDFTYLNDWTFTTGDWCIFKTGMYCTFKTGYCCIFNTGSHCTFNTYDNCTFKTGNSCTFKTFEGCTFKTGTNCTFKTGCSCTFSLYEINTCKFKLYDGNSTILDRADKKHYLLTKEFVQLRKIQNE